MTSWIENDTLFKKELETGNHWSNHVASVLNENQIPCYATKMVFRDSIEEISDFSKNDKDIVLTNPTGHIEVKSRNLKFDVTPESYPYETAFVDTLDGWNKKAEKPLAVVLVSQRTSELLVIPTTSEPYWGQETKYDNVRGIYDTWLTVHKTHLRPLSDLLDHLRRFQ